MDVLCKDQVGVQYIVEMQVAKVSGFEKRAQYYAAKAYANQLNKSEAYHNLKEIIFIAITDFIMFPDKEAYKSDHVVLDKKTGEHDLKDFSFTFIELPKFKKSIDQLSTMTEKWAYFFKYADETSQEDFEKIKSQDGVIKKAYAELDKFHWSDNEIKAYDQELKNQMDFEGIMAAAKEEGELRGIEKGKLEGELEGKLEGKLEIAKNMLNKGLELSLIKEITGLSEQEIQALKS